MQRVIRAGLGALAILSLTATAGEAGGRIKRPVYKAPVYKAPALWNWAGTYVGGNLGYSFGRSGTTATLYDTRTAAVLAAGAGSFPLNGVIGGAQIGQNWVVDRWVVGFETDFQASGQNGSASFACPAGACTAFAGAPLSGSLSQRLRWFGTVRGRFGTSLTPTALLYFTAGAAYGGVTTSEAVAGVNALGAAAGQLDSTSVKGGWTVGAGVETGLWGHWTAKLEYLYLDFGVVSGATLFSPLVSPSGGLVSANFSSRVTDSVVRLGMNYKF
jgi:outer membrane immunogenic protein